MVSGARLILLIIVCAIASFLFEWRHIWPVNQDRVMWLRLIFYGFLFAALIMAHFRDYKTWGWIALLGGFVITALISRAPMDVRYVFIAGVCVVGFATLSLWRPLSIG